MEKISDEFLEYKIALLQKSGCEAISINSDVLLPILQELKERRAADKLLDIKGQLRLVRDKCPGMWDLIVTSLYACPSMIDTGLQPNLLDSKDICYGFGNDNCKECWDKALGGDE